MVVGTHSPQDKLDVVQGEYLHMNVYPVIANIPGERNCVPLDGKMG
jgi:hypothetical protein